jgi:hypothetical protein
MNTPLKRREEFICILNLVERKFVYNFNIDRGGRSS